MCNLNVIVVLDFICRDLYLLFAILFSSKYQNSIFYQHMRPKSGLKSPRPLVEGVPNLQVDLLDYLKQSLVSYITKTCPCNVYPLEPHFYIVKLGFAGVYLFFLFLLQNIDCGYSLEPPRRGGSNVYPQSMF